MFIAVSLTIAKNWKQLKCPSADDWTNKMWYIHTKEYYSAFKRKEIHPWLVWLNGLRASLQTKRLLVWFPARAHCWAADQVPSWGMQEAIDWCISCTLLFLSLSFSLPSPLSKKINKTFFKKKGNSDTCYDVDETWRRCVKWNSQSQKGQTVWFHLREVSKAVKFIETESRREVWGWELFDGCRIPLLQNEKVLELCFTTMWLY